MSFRKLTVVDTRISDPYQMVEEQREAEMLSESRWKRGKNVAATFAVIASIVGIGLGAAGADTAGWHAYRIGALSSLGGGLILGGIALYCRDKEREKREAIHGSRPEAQDPLARQKARAAHAAEVLRESAANADEAIFTVDHLLGPRTE